MTNQPEPQENIEIDHEAIAAETNQVADILMRILAGRKLVVVYNSCFTILNTVANDIPPDAKAELAQHLLNFHQSLISVNKEPIQ